MPCLGRGPRHRSPTRRIRQGEEGKTKAAPAGAEAPKAQAKTAAKPAANAKASAPKVEVKAEAKAATKPAAKPPAKAAAAPAAKPAAPASPKPTAKPAAKPVAKAAAKSTPPEASAPAAPPVPTPTPAPAPAPALHVKAPAPKTAAQRAAAKAAPQNQLPTPAPLQSVNRFTDRFAPAAPAARLLAMPDSEYMNDKQLDFFRAQLQKQKDDLLSNAGETTEHLREDTSIVPDPADRATIEEEHALELRTRDRERKLLKKIAQSLSRLDTGEYGYCDETGEPIGLQRLLARPTATLSLEAQQRRELKQKMFGD